MYNHIITKNEEGQALNMINLSKRYTAAQIIKAIAEYDSVSFDIFDTLVKRAFAAPEDVFLRVAKDYCVNYGTGRGGGI